MDFADLDVTYVYIPEIQCNYRNKYGIIAKIRWKLRPFSLFRQETKPFAGLVFNKSNIWRLDLYTLNHPLSISYHFHGVFVPSPLSAFVHQARPGRGNVLSLFRPLRL